ncbi:MAG: hypothetical protein JSS81_23800 [Acidobacteria bacterium]|nr:hypothetical protein [Acidobacteriota bacterium]
MSSLVSLLIVACALLTVGFACGGSDKPADNKPADNKPAASPSASSSAKTDSSATPQTSSAPKDIAGKYSATGKNSDGGGNYEADLEVISRDSVYQFRWDSAGRKYDGVGVMTGDKVAVSFTDGPDGTGCGVELFKINADGSLDGKAGYWGNNTSETEKATRTSGTDLEGSYEIKGKNPKGETYQGEMTVTKKGQGYEFIWKGTNGFKGFGVKVGDSVSVGFGGDKCGFVAYEVKSDGTLEGKWGSAGSSELGTETAKKK